MKEKEDSINCEITYRELKDCKNRNNRKDPRAASKKSLFLIFTKIIGNGRWTTIRFWS